MSNVRRIIIAALAGAVLAVLLVGVQPASALVASLQELNRRAVQHMNQEKFVEARDLLLKAIETMPYEPVLKSNLSRCYLALGMQELGRGRYVKAREALAEGRTYDDSESLFWLFRGLAYFKEGNYDKAEDELEQARRMNPGDVRILKALAETYYLKGALEQAIDQWQAVLKIEPGDTHTRERLDKAQKEQISESGMDQSWGGHFTISYDAGRHSRLGDEVLEVLEQGYNDLGGDLGVYPPFKISVLLYTQKQFSQLTGAPDWADGLFDGKIRVPVGGLDRMTPDLRRVLYHELCHVFTVNLSRDRAPFWVNEGLAELAERRFGIQPMGELSVALAQRKTKSFSSLATLSRKASKAEVALAYQQSYSLVSFLVDRYGWFSMEQFLKDLGTGAPLEKALGKAFGFYDNPLAELEERWLSDPPLR